MYFVSENGVILVILCVVRIIMAINAFIGHDAYNIKFIN